MTSFHKPFGPSQREIWRQLSAEIDAPYVDDGWKGDKVVATHGEWTVTLDTVIVMAGKVPIEFTRLRAPYVNPDGFRFVIYRGDFFSELAKWFGMQDVETGHEAFDRDFIIKGSDAATLRRLFESERLRALVSQQPEIHLTIKDDEGELGPKLGEHVDEVSLTLSGVINDVERLRALYELFGETLNELCRIGSSYERAPEADR